MTQTKQCTKCKSTKSIDLFNKHAVAKDGLSHYCKDCTREISKKYHTKITPEEWAKRKRNRKVYSKITPEEWQQRKIASVEASIKRRQDAIEARSKAHEDFFQESIKDFKGEYKPVPENPNHYALSDGRVWSRKYAKFLTPVNHVLGYLFIGKFVINGKKKFCLLHQVIAHTFLGPIPDGYEINHIDGNKHNNSTSNLEYVTRQENMSHAFDTGLMHIAKKPVIQYHDDLIIAEYESATEAQKQTGISNNHIGNCCRGKKWHKTAGGFTWKFA